MLKRSTDRRLLVACSLISGLDQSSAGGFASGVTNIGLREGVYARVAVKLPE